jgi:coiled-coil domain-containing protein 55
MFKVDWSSELQKKQGGPSTGMAHFYRKLLEESEQQHEVTVAATQGKRIIGPQGPVPNLTITKPPELMPLSDLELAKAAREHGKEVEVNDDGQIVDKRDLLSAGLNLSLPNTRRLGKQSEDTAKVVSDKPVDTHTAVGTAASRREINERRRREIMQQMEVETTRVEHEKQKQEDEKLRRTVAKRNNGLDVQSARERYLTRKRQRLEDSAASPDNDLDDKQ